MLDPVSVGVALTAIAIVIALIFYLSSEGDDFEKAYDENARKILNQDDKPKQKVKTTKKRDNREKKVDKSEPDTTAADTSNDSIAKEAVADVASVPATTLADVKQKKVNKRKDKVHASSESESCAVTGVDSDKENTSSPVETVSIAKEEQHETVVDAEGKKKKKNKGKKDAILTEQVAEEVAGLKVQTKQEKAVSQKKAKPVVINISDLDSDKVLTRLASLDEIEPEYISYLATYFHDSNAKLHSVTDSITSLKSAEVDLKKKTELHQVARLTAEKQLSDNQRIVSELNAKVNALNATDSSCKQQLSTLTTENETLKAALTKSAMDASEGIKARSAVAKLNKEHSNAAARIVQLETELNAQMQLNDSMKQQLQNCNSDLSTLEKQQAEFESLKSDFATLDSVARQMKAELEDKKRMVEDVKQQAAGETVRRAGQDREELLKQFNKEKADWVQKEANLMEEYQSLQALVAELHKEVAKFETYKHEQATKTSELVAREARVIEMEKEKTASVQQALEELAQENAELKKQITSLGERLETASAAHSAEMEQLKSDRDLGDEIVILSKSATLEAVPSASLSNIEVEELRQENVRLNEKNEKLEVDTSATMQSERQLVEKSLGPLVKAKKLQANLDSEGYAAWVADVAASISEKLSGGTNPSKEVKPKNNSEVLASDSGDVKLYRNALTSLSAELTRIESLSCEQKEKYESTIRQLELKLQSATKSLVFATRMKTELKDCLTLKQ